MVELELFTNEIVGAQGRVAALQRRLEEIGGQTGLPLELLEELVTSLEELQVAEEELRQQNEELLGARAAIEAEKQRYQELYQFAPDGYLVTDAEGMIREANRAAGAMLGIAPEFLVGKPMANFLPAEERRAFRSGLLELRNAERLHAWGVRLQPRQRAPFPAALTVATARDARSAVTSLRWLMRDITEPKRIEEQIRRLNTRLEETVRERTAQLEAVNRTQEQLLASEKAARQEAEAVQERLIFLAGASSLLASSLDCSYTLSRLTCLIAPYLADWCAVDLVESDGRLSRVAAGGQEWVGQVLRELTDGTNTDLGALAVIRTGEPMAATHDADGFLTTVPASTTRRWPTSCLGIDAYLCVPLPGRERPIGAITLVQAGSERCFDATDLAVAEDLGRRAAAAVESARLYQEACAATEAKDRLVSVMREGLQRSLTPLEAATALLRTTEDGSEEKCQVSAVVEQCSRQLAHLAAELNPVERS